MKRISIEEHFMSEDLVNWLCSRKGYPRAEITEDVNHNRKVQLFFPGHSTPPVGGMLDVDEGRLKEMDRSGIDMEVLSFPGVIESLDPSDGIQICKRANDELAKITRQHPDRFAGFAALPIPAPAEAALELERSVKDLGLKGALIHPNMRTGDYVDDPKYWAIFEMAEKLAVPIYLHPGAPSADMIKPFLTYPLLSGSIWGFAADAGLRIMRLIFSGVFDKYPDLKIIIGHMGEALPFWLWRIDNRWQELDASKRRIPKKPSHYVKENIFVTTSGVFSAAPLLCTYLELGADRILFAVDYPFESNLKAVQFMDTAPICDSDREKIYHLNAEKLLGL